MTNHRRRLAIVRPLCSSGNDSNYDIEDRVRKRRRRERHRRRKIIEETGNYHMFTFLYNGQIFFCVASFLLIIISIVSSSLLLLSLPEVDIKGRNCRPPSSFARHFVYISWFLLVCNHHQQSLGCN